MEARGADPAPVLMNCSTFGSEGIISPREPSYAQPHQAIEDLQIT